MSPDRHRCELICDESGQVIARAMVSADMTPEGRAALVEVVRAAQRWMAREDAADPVAAVERERRYAEGQRRVRERNQRLRGGS